MHASVRNVTSSKRFSRPEGDWEEKDCFISVFICPCKAQARHELEVGRAYRRFSRQPELTLLASFRFCGLCCGFGRGARGPLLAVFLMSSDKTLEVEISVLRKENARLREVREPFFFFKI